MTVQHQWVGIIYLRYLGQMTKIPLNEFVLKVNMLRSSMFK